MYPLHGQILFLPLTIYLAGMTMAQYSFRSVYSHFTHFTDLFISTNPLYHLVYQNTRLTSPRGLGCNARKKKKEQHISQSGGSGVRLYDGPDLKLFIMPPTLKKLMRHIAFGACVSGCVGAWVGHTFCTYCNF